jgi:hypothetical protein
MSDKEDRIARLSQRFKTHTGGRPKNDQKSRERQSLYLDANLIERVDKTYKEIEHQLYPKEVSKSLFLETILEYGLENITAIKSLLSDLTDTSASSA